MNKQEALDFLGLKESVDNEVINNKYQERYSYFKMLHSNAPNKIIQSIQQQNLDKMEVIKKVLLEPDPPKKKAQESWFTTTIIKGVNSIFSGNKEKEIIAWLIVHTENRATETFNLYEGINYIGRKKRADSTNSIVLDNDPFVSRTHAFIKCKAIAKSFEFELYDGDGDKPSVNGTYLNGNEGRINYRCFLRENDTIQIGTTKLMFKIKRDDTTESREVESVLKSKYVKTINIDSNK